jgi:hypothetical protein
MEHRGSQEMTCENYGKTFRQYNSRPDPTGRRVARRISAAIARMLVGLHTLPANVIRSMLAGIKQGCYIVVRSQVPEEYRSMVRRGDKRSGTSVGYGTHLGVRLT